MKRAILFLLALLFCFSAVSCGKQHSPSPTPSAEPSAVLPSGTELTYHDVYDPETDFDNRFGRGYWSIVETDDAYYIIFVRTEEKYLYYHDKATGEYDLLCGKPECLHDSDTCNAMIEARAQTLNLVNGRLYFETAFTKRSSELAPTDCRSIALDGTDRRLEFEMPCLWENGPWNLYYHRGKFYGASMPDWVVDGIPGKHIGITSWDAATGEYKLILSKDGCEGQPNPKLFFFGKYVYFCFASSRMDEGKTLSKLEVCRWDIETELLETLYVSDDFEIPGMMFSLWVESEDKVYIASSWPEINEPTPVFLLSGGTLREAFSFNDFGAISLLDGVVQRHRLHPEENSFEIELTDYEGNPIYHSNIDMSFLSDMIPGTEFFSYYSTYGDKNTLYHDFIVQKAEDKKQFECIVRFDFQEPGAEPKKTLLCVDTYR